MRAADLAFLLLILASFALADISNLSPGGGSLPQNTLAKVGGVELTAAELDSAMQRRLAALREQNPQATYADLAGDFNAIVDALSDLGVRDVPMPASPQNVWKAIQEAQR